MILFVLSFNVSLGWLKPPRLTDEGCSLSYDICFSLMTQDSSRKLLIMRKIRVHCLTILLDMGN